MDTLIYNLAAAGNIGLHKVCTALRFIIDGKDIRELEIWEMERKVGSLSLSVQ